MILSLCWGQRYLSPPTPPQVLAKSESCRRRRRIVRADGFPAFLPKEVEKLKDSHAISLAKRIARVPVQLTNSEGCIMSSCVKPSIQGETDPVVLPHGFDRSLWRSYIKRPMVLVGPSLGAAVAIDFAVNHPEAVCKLIFIDASVYVEGSGNMAAMPKMLAYAGVALLKSVPLRLYANLLAFNSVSWSASLEWMNIGRLHCLLPWWEDTTVNFMSSGGYNVTPLIKQVKQKTLIIWGENDQIISYKFAVRLHSDLQSAILRQIPDCGHIPHVEKPSAVVNLIIKFVQEGCC